MAHTRFAPQFAGYEQHDAQALAVPGLRNWILGGRSGFGVVDASVALYISDLGFTGQSFQVIGCKVQVLRAG